MCNVAFRSSARAFSEAISRISTHEVRLFPQEQRPTPRAPAAFPGARSCPPPTTLGV